MHTYLDVALEVRSPAVRRIAKTSLDNFSEFLKEFHQTTPDKIISDLASDHQLAFDILQAWVNWVKKREIITRNGRNTKKYPTARTVKVYFQHIKNYLHYMGVKFHPDDLRKEVKLPRVLEHERHGVKIDEIKTILSDVKLRKKALYLAQLSSGMRIGELVRLRKKHLDFTGERIKVKIPAEFTKTGHARTTFFSKEFEKVFSFELKKLDDNDLLFSSNDKWEYARENETQYLQEVCKRNELKNITTHSFRAYFITKVSRLDSNLAKLFAGQKGYLIHEYDRLDDDEKLEKYLEFEPELLIFEKSVKDKELKQLKKRVAELEDYKKESHAFWVNANKMGEQYPDFMDEFIDKLNEIRKNKKS